MAIKASNPNATQWTDATFPKAVIWKAVTCRKPTREKESSPESNCSPSPLASPCPFSGDRCWLSCMVVMKDALASMVQRKSPSFPNSSCSREFLGHKLNEKEKMSDLLCLCQHSATSCRFHVIVFDHSSLTLLSLPKWSHFWKKDHNRGYHL